MGDVTFSREMEAAGYPVSVWANGPGEGYSAHSHSYQKILCCLEGSIVFHTADGDFPLRPGERLVLAPGVEHAATVGPAGVALRRGPRPVPVRVRAAPPATWPQRSTTPRRAPGPTWQKVTLSVASRHLAHRVVPKVGPQEWRPDQEPGLIPERDVPAWRPRVRIPG